MREELKKLWKVKFYNSNLAASGNIYSEISTDSYFKTEIDGLIDRYKNMDWGTEGNENDGAVLNGNSIVETLYPSSHGPVRISTYKNYFGWETLVEYESDAPSAREFLHKKERESLIN